MTGFHILAEQKEEISSCNFVMVCISAGTLNFALTVLVKKTNENGLQYL
jgi:hypothetical protein